MADYVLSEQLKQQIEEVIRWRRQQAERPPRQFQQPQLLGGTEFKYFELKKGNDLTGTVGQTVTAHPQDWNSTSEEWETNTDEDSEFDITDVLGIYRGRGKDKFDSPHDDGSKGKAERNTESSQWEIVEITPHALWITGSLTDDFDTDEDFTVDGVSVMFPTGAIIVDTDPAADITAHNGHDWDGSENALAELRWNEASTQWDCVELDC